LEYQTGASCNARYPLFRQKENFEAFDFDTYKVDELNKELTWTDGEMRAKRVIELIKKIKNDNEATPISYCKSCKFYS
jgi:hypothetical protein